MAASWEKHRIVAFREDISTRLGVVDENRMTWKQIHVKIHNLASRSCPRERRSSAG